MEKVCRKSALKASPIPRFNLGNSPKTANACKRLKQDHDKVNLIFFLCTQILLMDKIMKTKKIWN